MTKEELEKYTVDFMNNEASINWAKIDSIMGKTLIKYAEVFQKRIAELEKINTDGLSELNHINGELIIENEKLKKKMQNLKHRLSIISVMTPIIYVLVAIFNFTLPMQKFAYWSWTTLLTELLIYGIYIFTLKN